MDDTERSWLREKLYEHAAELGEQRAISRAQADDVRQVRLEVRDGFAGIRAEMSSHYNHVRGEVAGLRTAVDAIKEEDRRRTEMLLERMEDRDRTQQRAWKLLLLGAGALIVFGQQAIEHLPQILSLLGP